MDEHLREGIEQTENKFPNSLRDLTHLFQQNISRGKQALVTVATHLLLIAVEILGFQSP